MATEAQLRLSEERYRSLVLATSAVVWTTDPQGRCLEPHPGWEKFTGQPFTEQRGDGGMKVVHPDDREELGRVFANAAAAQEVFEAEYRLWHAASASWHYVFSRGVPLLNSDGSIREWIGTITDIDERRLAIDQLRESEALFRSMADTAPVMIWIAGTDKRCTWFNRPWLEFTGRAMEQECGNGWAEGVHPDDFARAMEIYTDNFDARRNFRMEYRLRAAGNIWHWVLGSGAPRFSPAGEFLGYIGSLIDIDAFKKTEDELRAQEARLQLTLQAGHMGTWDRDMQTGKLGWSPQQYELFGLKPGPPEISYDTWRDRVHPDDLERVETQLEQAMRDRTEFRRTYRTVWPDGSVHWLHSRGQFFFEGDKAVRLRGVLIDVTEQKRSEEALRETTTVLQSIVEACPLAIMLLNTEGIVKLWSASAERMFGWKSEEVVGRFSPAVGEKYKEQFLRNIEMILAGNQLRAHETQRLTRSGKSIDVAVWTAPTEVHGHIHYLALVADISERKRLEDQVRHSQKLESLGVLAGGIAHDFNNLLTAILGNVSLASDIVPPDDPIQRMFENAIEGCERAGTLTNQLLAYAGKGRFVLEPVRFDELVRRMSELILASVPKHVVVTFSAEEDLPVVEGDSGQFQQIAMNLIINAAEAVPRNAMGRVSVRMSSCELTAAERLRDFSEDLPDGIYLKFEVEDNGIGMSTETRLRIFDPFFTTKFTGRGLGLAAVQGIVRGHRGALRVDSTPGLGSVFTVILPVAPSVAAARTDAKTDTTGFAGPGTILVVDDEETVRITARRTLQRYGYTVVEAVNGEEALAVCRALPHLHAVVLDLTMPVMDGVAVLEHLHAMDSSVKVILCSGYNEHEVRERVSGRKVSAFLQKPYTSAKLSQIVREALEQ